MNLHAIGTSSFLRYQLENKIRQFLKDDKMIVAEGVDSLTSSELHSACNVRGMRIQGVPDWKLRQDLQEWVDLHLHQQVPATLLLLSRAFTIQEDVSHISPKILQATLSSLPQNLIEATEQHTSGMVEKSQNERTLELIQEEEALIKKERDVQAKSKKKESLEIKPIEVSETGN
jgi:LETM1 and EF-hand domain-containing protein 1